MLLLGDGRVGKSSFLARHLSGEFVKRYRPTEAGKRYGKGSEILWRS